MPTRSASPFPSVDRVLNAPLLAEAVEQHGRIAVVDAIRAVLERLRADRLVATPEREESTVALAVLECLAARHKPALKRMFNLTGTVLHTNLGRALLSEAAVEHVAMAMRHPCNLEFDVDSGGRGDRDDLIEDLLIELTGAEAATVVNNNAGAVLLALAALAGGREVLVSRGELIEIGGAFRIPDVMRSAGVTLVEVGTTNRTHARDYETAISPDTAAIMKVHTSNYAVVGFTASVPELELAAIAQVHGVPLIADLGAGSLIDLGALGLPREPIVRDVLAAGADVVTFSGDKLLGGPQAGLIVGKKPLIDRIRRHPLKRALRLSKLPLAALEATLLAYRRPDRLIADIPTLRLLTRQEKEIASMADRIAARLAAALGAAWKVTVVAASSQVGSGSLPVDVIPSRALAIGSANGRSGGLLQRLATRFRQLPVPVIGRVADDHLLLDLRCLEDEACFVEQLEHLGEDAV